MKKQRMNYIGFLLVMVVAMVISSKSMAQTSFAQSTSSGIFFQAVAKDNFANPAKDRKIYVLSSILQSSSTGNAVLTEIHETTTDAIGIFNISIGQGTRKGGTATSLDNIAWGQGPFYLNLKIAISPTAPITNWDFTKDFIDLGTSPFGMVPYALYAGSVSGFETKLNISDTSNMLSNYTRVTNLNALIANKANLTDSTTVFVTPTQLKTYVNGVAQNNIADGFITSIKIADAAVTDSKINTVSGSKINGTIALTNGGTGAANAATARANLGLVIGTDILAQRNFGTAASNNTADFEVPLTLVSPLSRVGNTIAMPMSGNAANGYLSSTDWTNFNNKQAALPSGLNGQVLTTIGSGTLSWTTINSSGGGISSIGTIGTASSTNGATINSNILTLTPADASNGGIVTNGTQTFSGRKTFSSNISVNGISIGRGNGNNDESVAVGSGAMGASNINGKRNTAVGAGAMSQYNGTSWDNNTSVGYNNLPRLTTGSGNTSVGAESMMNLLTGVENTSIGNQSLINVTGNNNVGVGKRSGQTITSGSQNTIIGTDADVATNNLSNATALGYGANVAASNTIQLGNTSVTNVKTSGTITAGVVTYPKVDGTNGQVLTTNGSGVISWSTPSIGSNTTVTTISNSSNANGAIITSGALSLTPADATNGGILTNGSQTIAGAKTFNGKIQIGAGSSNTSAALDVQSSTQGLLLPRLTTSQRDAISNPVEGLILYNKDLSKFQGYVSTISSTTITNTNWAGNGSWYLGLGNMNDMFMGARVNDDGQTFTVSNANTKLNSIVLYFSSFNISSGSGEVVVSIYTGNTPGSGTLVGSSALTISSTGSKTFNFSTPLSLASGNYYFLVHANTVGINGGLAYCASQYASESRFQSQSINNGAYSYNTSSGESLYFIMNSSVESNGWVDLNN